MRNAKQVKNSLLFFRTANCFAKPLRDMRTDSIT